MWNYRVIAIKNKKTEEITYCIKEVYYNTDDSIFLIMVSEAAPFGESRGELRRDMRAMMKAFDEPTLKEWEIEFKPHDSEKEEE